MKNEITTNVRGEREYLGFNMFDHDPVLVRRYWNIANTFLTVWKDRGRDVAVAYLRHIDKPVRTEVSKMVTDMQYRGYKVVEQEVIRGLNASA